MTSDDERDRGRSGPRTVVGAWLKAISLSQRDLAEELSKRIPVGAAGFRDDEAAVTQAACEFAARRYFGPDYDVRAVTEFALWLREAWIGQYRLDVMQFEAVMRAALGEVDVDLAGITGPAMTKAHGVAASYICKLLDLDGEAVGELVAEAERTAVVRGW